MDIPVEPMPGTPAGKPNVLLLCTTRWFSTARLALALHQLGCRVELLGPANHPACASGVIARRYRWNGLAPVRSVREALQQSGAEMLIPADEWMVGYLRELVEAEPAGSALRARLQKALGGGEGFAGLQLSRIALMRLAAELGIATPKTSEIHVASDVLATLVAWPLPFLLKADATSGGNGVHVVNEPNGALALWRKMHQPLSLARALRRGLQFGEWEHMRARLHGETRDVVAQQFVHGVERTLMAVAHRGEMLACVSFEIVHTWFVRGPSSVLRASDDPALCEAARKLCRALGTTGFFGLDFLIDSASREPVLIEMNTRPTQLVHLSFGKGRDLLAAGIRAIAGVPVADRSAVTELACIALFPQEIHRDPESEVLAEAFHDVPWESPALIRRALPHPPAVLTGDVRWNSDRKSHT